MAERRFRVHGRVQGVGFRWWVRSRARELGVTGSVRNAEDGSVEVLARGTDSQLAQLRRLLAEGPATAGVASVDESQASGVPSAGFEIVH